MRCSRRQAGSADVLSGATGGTDRLLPGSTNNVLGSGSDPVTGLSKSGSGLVKRSPGVGVSISQQVPRTSLIELPGWYR